MNYSKIIELLSEERLYAKENFIPIIRNKSSEYLYETVKSLGSINILEIGTAIGYSGSIMLLANDSSMLTTMDINEKSLAVANKTFERLGLKDRVEIFNKDAKDVLVDLVNLKKKFDFIFLDGPKGQYIKYLPLLTDLLVDDGIIFADNIFLDGMVNSDKKIPHRKRTMVVNIRKYLEIVKSLPYETKIVDIEDGIAITKVKRGS